MFYRLYFCVLLQMKYNKRLMLANLPQVTTQPHIDVVVNMFHKIYVDCGDTFGSKKLNKGFSIAVTDTFDLSTFFSDSLQSLWECNV